MLTTVTHSCGIVEVVEGPECSDPYYYFAPWEEGRIQTRADGTKFVEHEGQAVNVEPYESAMGGGVYYRALLGAS